MNAEPIGNVGLSPPTYRALLLIARFDRTTPEEIAERVLAAYLQGRLGTIRGAQHEREVAGRARVIDLAARRGSQRPTRSSRSTGSRRRFSISSE
jgi:hypothetical protein